MEGIRICFHIFLTSTRDRDEWSASRLGRFTSRKEELSSHRKGGLLGLRVILGISTTCAGWEKTLSTCASTCFEQYVLIIRRSKLYYTASGIITPVGGHPVRRLRESSLNLRSKHVEAYNKLIIKPDFVH